MTEKLPHLKADQVISVLEKHGFTFISQNGSHQKWHQSDTGMQVIVPYHKGKQLPLGTLMSIIDGSGIPKQEFH
jgi:predicted RNA binding protein YcfA (HicA-like mRNA interferase family)